MLENGLKPVQINRFFKFLAHLKGHHKEKLCLNHLNTKKLVSRAFISYFAQNSIIQTESIIKI